MKNTGFKFVLYCAFLLSMSPQSLFAAVQGELCDLEAYRSSKSKFDSLVAQQADGSIVVIDEAVKRVARQYLRYSEKCYNALQLSLLSGSNHHKIDAGGLWFNRQPKNEGISRGQFVTFGTKWGAGSPFSAGRDRPGPASPGGTVTYSFISNGVSHDAENSFAETPPGRNVAISSLPGFQSCLRTEIVSAFNLWSAVADIDFQLVQDNGRASNAIGATGDIRIGAHRFPAQNDSLILAHAFFPPPNGDTISGDMHFNRDVRWSCDASGFDIGIVAIHELGHAIGLRHEEIRTAIMNPRYNPNVPSILTDDINGAIAIYGKSRFNGALIVPPITLLLDEE